MVSSTVARAFNFLTRPISDEVFTKLRYFLQFGEFPDLEQPKTYNEKIQHFKLYGNTDLVTKCCDKYRVREYVDTHIEVDILSELYWVGENPRNIPFEDLPQSFVMKCNHGCGYNILVEDKDDLDEKEAIRQLETWLKEDFWRRGRELNYKGIEKRVVVEEYLSQDDGSNPRDVKLFVMGGDVEFVQIDIDMFGDHERGFFSTDWEKLPFGILYPIPDQDVERRRVGKHIAHVIERGQGGSQVDEQDRQEHVACQQRRAPDPEPGTDPGSQAQDQEQDEQEQGGPDASGVDRLSQAEGRPALDHQGSCADGLSPGRDRRISGLAPGNGQPGRVE